MKNYITEKTENSSEKLIFVYCFTIILVQYLWYYIIANV